MKKIIVLMIAGFMLVSCDPQENPDPDEVVVSESAQIIEDQTWNENILLIDSTDYTLTFREDLNALLPLEIGDVLVSTVGNGLLRKITGITSTKGGGEIIVETDFASLTDVIEQGTIQAQVVLTPDDIQEVVFHYDGITPEPANVKGSVNHVTNWNINTELYSGVRLTGQFISDMTFILDINVAGSSLNSAKSGIIMSETLTLQLSAALEREFDKDITIATITFAPIIIPVVGPLALVIVPKVEVKLGLEGSVGGTVTCSATQEIFVDAGIQYAKASGWSDYKTFTNEFSNTKPVLEKANAEASIYIQPELSTKLYNVAGPYINTKIYGKLEIDANQETVEKEDPWWKLSVGINLNAGMNVEIFDLATLNYEKSNIIGYEWLIAQSPTKPKVTTGDVTNIQSTTASCSGNVTADGGQAVTDRGICWSTSQNPTIENSKTSGGTGTGTFTGNLTGLTANTSYYVRAYATNSEGTAYGVEKVFTTEQNVEDDGDDEDDEDVDHFIDSRDGKVYNIIIIGDQVWMAENLAYLPSVSPVTTGSTTGSHYYVYGYDGGSVTDAKSTVNYSIYGVLYNWSAALTACPEGWHLPSDAEWTILTDYLGGTGIASDKMKTLSLWNSNSGATNESGFSALPAGVRYNVVFFDLGNLTHFWSSTEYNLEYNKAWVQQLLHYSSEVFVHAMPTQIGCSVRCIRD